MATKYELYLICEIAERAAPFYDRCDEKIHTAIMDIEHWHDQAPLALHLLLTMPMLDFAHDIAGIRRYINRRTGKIQNGCSFVPRSALENHFPRRSGVEVHVG